MNDKLKKVTALSLSGIIALSPAMTTIYAQPTQVNKVVRESSYLETISHKVGDIDTKLIMVDGKSYYDDNDRLVFDKDTSFELSLKYEKVIEIPDEEVEEPEIGEGEEGLGEDAPTIEGSEGSGEENEEGTSPLSQTIARDVKVSVENGKCKAVDGIEDTYALDNISEDSKIVISEEGKSDIVIPITDYFKLAYPQLKEAVFLSKDCSIGDISVVNADGKKLFPGSYASGKLTYSYKFTIDDKMIPSDYSMKVSFAGKEVDSKDITIDGDKVKVVVDSDLENYAGEVIFKVELTDGFGNKSSNAFSLLVDTIAPEILEGSADWVDGVDGNTYFKLKGAYTPITFKVKEEGIGIKSIKVKEGETSFSVVKKSDNYVVNIPKADKCEPVFIVEDNMGNSRTYTLSQVLGCSSNVMLFGIPNPEVTFNVISGDNYGEWYKGNPINLKVSVANNKMGISKIEYSVAGNTVEVPFEGSVKEHSFIEELSQYVSDKGLVTLKVTVYDKTGSGFVYDKSVKIDNVDPYISNFKVSNSDSINIYDGIAYSSKELSISGSALDKESGVKSVEVLNGDTVVGNSLPYTISTDGSYSVKVVDNVGHSKIYSLQEIIGKDFTKVVISKNKPIIQVSPLPDTLEVEGIKWYTNLGSIIFNVQTSNLLETKVTVTNGVNTSNLGVFSEDNKVFSIDTKSLAAGVNTIKIFTKDKNGLSTTASIKVGIDKTKPIVSALKIYDEYKDRNGYIWFTSTPELTVSAKDNQTGIKHYVVVNKNGESRVEKTNKFKLATGDYAIKVVNGLGVESEEVLIKDSLETYGESIVIDSEKPVLSYSKPDADTGSWYSNDIKFSIESNDEYAVHYLKVVINNVEVFLEKGDLSSKEIASIVSTKGVDANEDGSYDIVITSTDKAGNLSVLRDTIYIDRVAPKIEKFVITSEEGYKEGKQHDGSDKYGFYLRGATEVDIHVTDGKVSSGMSKVYYQLENEKGGVIKGSAKIESGVATVKVPDNFKGFISAYAVDNVGNKGKTDKPDGIITESGNVHVNNSKVSFILPEAVSLDSSGHNLYDRNVNIDLAVKNSKSGVRKITWGVNESVKGVVKVDNNGNIDSNVANVTKEKNLIIKLNKSLPIKENSNNIKVWVKVEDRAGNISENSRVISIDKDDPVINVEYNTSNKSGYYSTNRSARIVITERNFNKSLVKLRGSHSRISNWKNIGDNKWEATVVFSDNKDYKWGIDCVDKAGNVAKSYLSGKFTVDKRAPEISISFDKNSKDIYYNGTRTATVKVVDKNFDSSKVSLKGSGSLGSWRSDGDVHTSKVTFNKDGEYSFNVSAQDKAGNSSNNVKASKFIIDMKNPKVTINGVKDGTSYKKGVSNFTVTVSDEYLNPNKCSAKLVRRNGDVIPLKSSVGDKKGQFVFSGVPNKKSYDDLYKLVVVTEDKAGNTEKSNLQFSINRYGSQYDFGNEHLLKNVVNEPTTVKLTETSVDKLNTDKCKVVIIRDGDTIEVDKSLVSVKESGGKKTPWTYEYSIDESVFSTDGKYQIQVFSEDLSGKDYSSMSQEYYFVLDTTKPQVIVSGVEDGGFYKEVFKKVAIDIRDLSGIKDIEVTLDGQKLETTKESDIHYVTIHESSSKRNLSVSVTDKAGNITVTEVKNFVISSSTIQSIANSGIFKIAAGVGVLIIGALAAVLVRGRRKSKVIINNNNE